MQADLFTVGAGYLDIQAVLASTALAPAAVGKAMSPTVTVDSAGNVVLVTGSSVLWGKSVWGTNAVWGNSVLSGTDAQGLSVLWGTSTLQGNSVLWGTSTVNPSVLWGTSVLWGRNTSSPTTKPALPPMSRSEDAAARRPAEVSDNRELNGRAHRFLGTAPRFRGARRS